MPYLGEFIMSIGSHRELLRQGVGEKLNKIKANNPAFSLRALAHRLEVSPSTLSQVLSKKRPLTPKVSQKFINFYFYVTNIYLFSPHHSAELEFLFDTFDFKIPKHIIGFGHRE